MAQLIGNTNNANMGELSVFDDFSIWFLDFFEAMRATPFKIGLLVPLIGFKFMPDKNMDRLLYRNIALPTIYGTQKVLNAVKEPLQIRVNFSQSYLDYRSFATIYGKNLSLVALLEAFADNGGSFLIITTSGFYHGCSLVKVSYDTSNPSMMAQQGSMVFQYNPIVPTKNAKRSKMVNEWGGSSKPTKVVSLA